MLKDKINLSGRFTAVCFRPDGTIRWVLHSDNIVTLEGRNHFLDVVFHNTTPVNPWYVVIFENDYTPTGSETYASPGFTECTAYDEATRPEYVESAASGGSLGNTASRAEYTINATKTLYGAGLVSVNTKGDTVGGGILWSLSRFATEKLMYDDDTLQVGYTISGADDGV